MAEPIILSGEASVKVMVLESCPDHVREDLEFARDEIYKAFPTNSRLGKRLGKKLNNKTIGVMCVQFSDGSEKTIFAISGQGADEWKMKEVTFSNKKFDGVQERLLERDVVWAPLTCEHPAYQSLQGEEIQGGQEERRVFAEEYRQRLKNKAENMKKAIDQMTEKQFKDLFIKKAEYRLEDFIEHVILVYYKISQCEQYREQILEAIERIMVEGPQQISLEATASDGSMRETCLKIIQDIEAAEVKPTSADDLVKRFVEPKYKDVIPESQLGTVCAALGYMELPITSKHADMTVRCAEDNALNCLIGIQESRKHEGYTDRVTRMEWFSANLASLKHKPLCPFCKLAFVPRARQLVTREAICVT